MNKYLIIIFFLLFLNLSQAQDSLAVAQDTVAKKWDKKDIVVDSSAIEKRAFAKNTRILILFTSVRLPK